MLDRSEMGEAKKKSSSFSSLISMKKLCIVEGMQKKMGCPSPGGTTVTLIMCLLYAASPPFILVSPTTAAFMSQKISAPLAPIQMG